MSIGSSGRIVIEIDPELKHDLYSALEKEGLNLKRWFLQNAQQYLKNRAQLNLQLDTERDSNKSAYR